MRKLAMLRAHLLAAVPSLARDPDRLLTFVVDGRIIFRRGQASLTHEYSAGTRLVIQDFTGDTDAIILPLLEWLSRYEPHIDPNDGIAFDIEVLDGHTVDIEITVQLTERVVAPMNCDTGRIEAKHVVNDYDTDECGASVWQLYTRNHVTENEYRLIAEWPRDE